MNWTVGRVKESGELAGSTYELLTKSLKHSYRRHEVLLPIATQQRVKTNILYRSRDIHRLSFILYNVCFIEVQLSTCHIKLQIWSLNINSLNY